CPPAPAPRADGRDTPAAAGRRLSERDLEPERPSLDVEVALVVAVLGAQREAAVAALGGQAVGEVHAQGGVELPEGAPVADAQAGELALEAEASVVEPGGGAQDG